MMVRRIAGTTRVLGKSQGYLGLPVRDVKVNDSVNGPDTSAMETAWEPTPTELARLNQGASVVVQILGETHPPIMLGVGDGGDADDADAPLVPGKMERIAAVVPPRGVELDRETAMRALVEIRAILEEEE